MSQKSLTSAPRPRKHKNDRHFFTEEEDNLLAQIMKGPKPGTWEFVAKFFSGRLPRQCRDRWLNYLAPWIKHGEWTREEDDIIKATVLEIGTKWSHLQKLLPGRTDNDIKNRWYTYLAKETKETKQAKQTKEINPTEIDFWTELERDSLNFCDFQDSFFASVIL
jgi:hypothetical protein